MTEDPQTPQDDETPEASAGDVAEPEQSADPADAAAPDETPAPEAETPAPEAETPAPEAEAPAAEETPAAEEAPAAEAETPEPEPAPAAAEAASADAPAEPSADEAAAGEAAPAAEGDTPTSPGDEASAEERRERPKPTGKRKGKGEDGDKPEVVPGAHLEPDLVLEAEPSADDPYASYASYADGEDGESTGEPTADGEQAEAPAVYTPKDFAADARYSATGKRKTAVARVILKPGSGTYTVNGKSLEVFFPRLALQKQVRQPIETAGYESRMDVVVKIHGGGVSSQAGALRHGIARALTEADPNLRGEMKKRGFLTRDARVKERKKAGLKKARKRPQFSKR